MKRKLRIRHLPTPEEVAEAGAVELLGLLMRRPVEATPFGIALSGGRIAVPFYKSIVANARKVRTSFEEVHFFWADERCVPPTSPESNFGIAHAELFQPLEIPAANIHRIRAEMEGPYPLDEAEAELCRLIPLNDAGQPVLDLVILGMGEDGHVASLFPEERSHWIADGKVYRRVRATKPPPERITLGYQPILAAREVWVLASGIAKLSAYRSLLAGDERLPIARVAAGRSQTLVFQDIERPEE
jgi:6-phosphogluconolactonase